MAPGCDRECPAGGTAPGPGRALRPGQRGATRRRPYSAGAALFRRGGRCSLNLAGTATGRMPHKHYSWNEPENRRQHSRRRQTLRPATLNPASAPTKTHAQSLPSIPPSPALSAPRSRTACREPSKSGSSPSRTPYRRICATPPNGANSCLSLSAPAAAASPNAFIGGRKRPFRADRIVCARSRSSRFCRAAQSR